MHFATLDIASGEPSGKTACVRPRTQLVALGGKVVNVTKEGRHSTLYHDYNQAFDVTGLKRNGRCRKMAVFICHIYWRRFRAEIAGVRRVKT